MLGISIVLNVCLPVALLVVISKAKKTIREEKLATFAGCLMALSRALVNESGNQRFKLAAFELSGMMGRTDELEEDVRFYMGRAAFIRPYRSACVADMGGEYVRLLALQIAGADDEGGSQILEYMGSPSKDENGAVIEPKDYFGEEALVAAQLVAERRLLNHYAADLAGRDLRIFPKS